MSKRKYTKEFKLKVLKEHEEGASFYSLEKKYGITLGTVKRWNSAFQAHGEDALAPQNSDLCRYTAEFKKEVVRAYLSGGGSGQSIAKKYGIHAESTVLKWVKQYNSHEELTDSRKTGGYLMTKDIKLRKTTLEERIRIVEYCTSHANDYNPVGKIYSGIFFSTFSTFHARWDTPANSISVHFLTLPLPSFLSSANNTKPSSKKFHFPYPLRWPFCHSGPPMLPL